MLPDFGAFAIIPILMSVFFGLFFLAVLGLIIFTIVKNVQKAKAMGHDPFTLQTELAARAVDSDLLAPEHTIETRLRELDDLRVRNVITEAEYAKARSEAITAG